MRPGGGGGEILDNVFRHWTGLLFAGLIVILWVQLVLGAGEDETLVDLSTKWNVARFQEDGLFSDTSYVQHTAAIRDDKGKATLRVEQFSLCLWVMVNYLRGRSSTFISYATEESSEAVIGEFYYDNSQASVRFCVSGANSVLTGPACADANLDSIDHQVFHHVCVEVVSLPFREKKMKIYFNGAARNETDAFQDSLSGDSVLSLLGNGSFVLGQKQGEINGGFDSGSSFSGAVADIVFVSTALEDRMVTELAAARCNQDGLSERLIDLLENKNLLPSIDKWTTSNANVTMEDNKCDGSPELHVALFNHPVTFNQVKMVCHALHGHLPLANDQEVYQNEVYNKAKEGFYQILPHSQISRKCMRGKSGLEFWVGDPDNLPFLRTHNASSSRRGTPKIGRVGRGPKQIELARSVSDTYCGVCLGMNRDDYEVEGHRRLLLKGMCELEIVTKSFDQEYYVHGLMNGRLHFKGVENSHIYYDEEHRWRMQSLRYPEKFVRLSARDSETNYPIGRFNWIIESEHGLCDVPKAEPLKLTLSNCYPRMFTCDSGHCIHLKERCDTAITCHDKSDEVSCFYLQLNEEYQPSISPKMEDVTNPLPVYMNVSILAFPSIDTVNLKVTADFYLQLSWYDSRISFRDLNDVASLNSLTLPEMKTVWTPKIAYINALGPDGTKVNDITTGILVQQSEPLDEDLTLPRETDIYSGSGNSIQLTSEYYTDYACNFDLLYYPFDTQLCMMEFQVQGWTTKYIKLVIDGKGVLYQGDRNLVEYEIQLEEMQIFEQDGRSLAVIKVVFRRNMEYHVTNVFLQTFVLVSVGYLTFFFRVNNFTDRIMVTLTVMLVVATIMSTIQQGLPKTSYYKLIDYWLMFILNILAFMMSYHTYLQYTIKKDKDKLFIGHLLPPHHPPSRGDSSQKKWLNNDEEEVLKAAEKVNKFGKFLILAIIILFNTVFWAIALSEYVKDAEHYLHLDNRESNEEVVMPEDAKEKEV